MSAPIPPSPRLAEFDDFLALRLMRLRAQLNGKVAHAHARIAKARKARHQRIVDYDLDQQPFRYTSMMGHRCRTLAQMDGDE